MKSTFLFFTLGLVLSFGSFGQSLKDDLATVTAHLDSARSVSLQVAFSVYASKGGNEVYSSTASVDRKGKASVTVLGDIEIYEDETWRVDVDHSEQFVSIVKKETVRKAAKDAGVQFDVRELARLLGEESVKPPTIRLVSDKEDIRTYALTNLESLQEVQIVLNMKTKAIVSVTYTYLKDSDYKGQYIVLNYTRFSVNEAGKTPRAADYFTVSSKQYQLTGRFKDYQLTTLL